MGRRKSAAAAAGQSRAVMQSRGLERRQQRRRASAKVEVPDQWELYVNEVDSCMESMQWTQQAVAWLLGEQSESKAMLLYRKNCGIHDAARMLRMQRCDLSIIACISLLL
jgi:hypothetical protein